MALLSDSINTVWGSLLTEELVRNGINYFCISPGSRSTPLIVGAARNPRITTIISYDERGAAFHALGYARATGKPAAIITTSGTAAANCLPAAIEASLDFLPMIVLSADRPPELRDTGANQAINQISLLGKYCKWEFDLPCPDETIPPEMVLTTIDQAVCQARGTPAGPVHINCMFREPLEPSKGNIRQGYYAAIERWLDSECPYTSYSLPVRTPGQGDVEMIANVIRRTGNGILAVGALRSESEIKAVIDLAHKLGFPVFPDIASGLRLGCETPQIIHHFDQLLLSENLWQNFSPDTVLHIGGTITSKRFLQFLETGTIKNYIIVKDHPFRHDQAHKATIRVESGIVQFSAALTEALEHGNNADYLQSIKRKSGLVDSVLEDMAAPDENVTEPSVARIISHTCPEGTGIFLANSMPIREMDMFSSGKGAAVKIASNRAASGIEGTIASACGFAGGCQRPVTLVIGDLAFIHDLNSLSLVKKNSQPLIIVVINNHGGGIFSFLPIAEFDDVFEEYFATPHNFCFKDCASMFGIEYFQPATNKSFAETYRSAIARSQPSIIEIQTDRNENIRLHRSIYKQVVTILESQK